MMKGLGLIGSTRITFSGISFYRTLLLICLMLAGTIVPLHAGEIIRVVSYNTYNNPDDSLEDSPFSIVFNAIGNKSINGAAKRLDILIVSETDTGSSARLPNILNTLYGVNSYLVIISTPDGGNDRTGIVFDSTALTLLGTKELSDGLTHHILRAKFRPVGIINGEDIFVYAIHLKSGSTSADKAIRATEASLIRSDADSLGDGVNIIYAGDFNMTGSSEGAWTNMLVAGAGQGFDTANAPGEWRDDPTFKYLHTQNPRSDMDDRFDIQFVSGELRNNTGLEYSSNSYHVFGNNGTHTLGGPISSGAGAPASVLAALEANSDHLPTVADYTFGNKEIPIITPWAQLLLLIN